MSKACGACTVLPVASWHRMCQPNATEYVCWEERMKTYKRALTNSQASRCETARHPVCRCRCSGRLHGQGHAKYQAKEQALMKTQKTITIEEIAAILDGLIQLRLLEIK